MPAAGEGMGRLAAVLLCAAFAFGMGAAGACSMGSQVKPPTLIEVADTAEWVFIAHIERINPLTKEQDELALRILTGNVPMNVSFRVPVQLAEASSRRSLKGARSGPVVLQSEVHNCGVQLSAGDDYLILANPPQNANDGIRPLAGSFKLDDTAATQAKLAELQTHLSKQNPSTP
jgi:hypothetical protein